VEHWASGSTGQLVRPADDGPGRPLPPSPSSPGPPAGWYDDPVAPGLVRFWDGSYWTDRTRPNVQGPALVPVAAGGDGPKSGATTTSSAILPIAAAVLAFVPCLLPLALPRTHFSLVVTIGFVLVLFVLYLSITFVAASRRNVDLAVTLGLHEHHLLRYRRGNWSGRVRIDLDGRPVVRKWVFWGYPEKTYHLTVGTTERHNVTVVQTRPLVLPWLRPEPVEVFVDGLLVVTHSLAALERPAG
jgi:hypothetical protein